MWKTPVSPGFARIFCPRPLCDNLWQKFLTNVDNFFSPQETLHFSPKCGGKMSLMVEAAQTENRYVGGRKTASQSFAFRRRRNKFRFMISNDMCIGNHSSRPANVRAFGPCDAAGRKTLLGTQHSGSQKSKKPPRQMPRRFMYTLELASAGLGTSPAEHLSHVVHDGHEVG